MAIKASNQISIVDVTDAYSVILTSEAYTFVGNTSGAASGSTCSTQAVAYCGGTQKSVSVNQTAITCPSGISASVSTSGTPAVATITFTLSSTLTTAAEATIPVVVDGITVNKKFSFAVAKTGQQGIQGETGVSVTGITSYFKLNNSTTAPTIDTSWSTSPSATTSSNKYLWSYEKISYDNNTTSDTAAHIVATYAAPGSAGASTTWYSGTAITGTSTTATVFSGSGITDAKVNDQYLNISTGADNGNVYKCTTAGNASTAKWVYTGNIKGAQGQQGPQGDAGEDAIALSITSSNGTVFKNSSGSTVLSAHVYVGGVEASIATNGTVTLNSTTIGTIKWYKEGTSSAVATASTYTVQASAVTNVQAYRCQLEQ